jgi:tRNA(Arg) A34 adenosine deaminase TadA
MVQARIYQGLRRLHAILELATHPGAASKGGQRPSASTRPTTCRAARALLPAAQRDPRPIPLPIDPPLTPHSVPAADHMALLASARGARAPGAPRAPARAAVASPAARAPSTARRGASAGRGAAARVRSGAAAALSPGARPRPRPPAPPAPPAACAQARRAARDPAAPACRRAWGNRAPLPPACPSRAARAPAARPRGRLRPQPPAHSPPPPPPKPLPPVTEDDRRYMNMALDLAMLAYGKTHPNPHVGCVIVRDGEVRRLWGAGWGRDPSEAGRPRGGSGTPARPALCPSSAPHAAPQPPPPPPPPPQVVGEGYHPKAGQPHAEVFALRGAGEGAAGRRRRGAAGGGGRRGGGPRRPWPLPVRARVIACGPACPLPRPPPQARPRAARPRT